jgi:hypothetical protein
MFVEPLTPYCVGSISNLKHEDTYSGAPSRMRQPDRCSWTDVETPPPWLANREKGPMMRKVAL